MLFKTTTSLCFENNAFELTNFRQSCSHLITKAPLTRRSISTTFYKEFQTSLFRNIRVSSNANEVSYRHRSLTILNGISLMHSQTCAELHWDYEALRQNAD